MVAQERFLDQCLPSRKQVTVAEFLALTEQKLYHPIAHGMHTCTFCIEQQTAILALSRWSFPMKHVKGTLLQRCCHQTLKKRTISILWKLKHGRTHRSGHWCQPLLHINYKHLLGRVGALYCYCFWHTNVTSMLFRLNLNETTVKPKAFSLDPKQNHCNTKTCSWDPKQNQCKTIVFSWTLNKTNVKPVLFR